MTDEELCLLAQKGNEGALNELLKKYKSFVTKIARSYFLVGGDMDDIVQEGMIGLYKGIIHFSPAKNAQFKTFVTTCIKHQIQTAVKMASSVKNQVLSTAQSIIGQNINEDEEENEFEILLHSNLPLPEDKLIEKENMGEIKETIYSTLSKLELKVLSLYLKGYSYDEISNIGGLSKKSIDNALSRIKTKLSFLKG